MIKKILIFGCLVMGCYSYRNEYKNIRTSLSRFSIKPNIDEQVYKLIDTSSVYLNTKINGQLKIKDNKGDDIVVREKNNVIKFYKDGRVGMFQQADLKNINSIDPKKARMGIYNLSKKGFLVEFISHSPQAGIFFIEQSIRVNGDTIYIADDEYKYEYEYVRVRITKEFLKYAPDW